MTPVSLHLLGQTAWGCCALMSTVKNQHKNSNPSICIHNQEILEGETVYLKATSQGFQHSHITGRESSLCSVIHTFQIGVHMAEACMGLGKVWMARLGHNG